MDSQIGNVSARQVALNHLMSMDKCSNIKVVSEGEDILEVGYSFIRLFFFIAHGTEFPRTEILNLEKCMYLCM